MAEAQQQEQPPAALPPPPPSPRLLVVHLCEPEREVSVDGTGSLEQFHARLRAAWS